MPARYTFDYMVALLMSGGVSRDEAERIARDVIAGEMRRAS